MNNNLQLVKTKNLNGIMLDCYIKPEQTDKGAFWATRTQIGQLLGYAEPSTAIKNIHMRNKERLDKFSRVAQIELPSGGAQDVTIYNFMGLLEICRYSQQDTANQVIDTLWAIADEIRRTGSYSTKKRLPPRAFKDAEALIEKTFKCKTEADCQQVYALDKVFQDTYGRSCLEIAEIQPQVQPEEEPKIRNSREEELWQHIVSTFAPDEWFSTSTLQQTLNGETVSRRQIQRYLADFVERQMLNRHGYNRHSRYTRRH